MSDKSASARQYSTLGCLVLLILTSVIFIVWMSWRILHAPVPPKPVNDSLHRVDSLRRVDSLQHTDSARKTDSLRDIDSLVARNRRSFFRSSLADFYDSLFRFHLTYDSVKTYGSDLWEHRIRKIDIYHLQDDKPFQTIYTHSEQEVDIYGWRPFLMEDMNFDGYTDVGYTMGAYVNGCRQCAMWLYDPAKQKFVENPQLEELFDPEFDAKGKLVYSDMNATNSPFDEELKCFSWKNGKLFLEHSEVCESNIDGTSSTLTMKKRVNGDLITRSGKYKTPPIDSIGRVIYNWDEMK